MGTRELGELLGAPPPPGIAALPAQAQDDLAVVISAALKNQSEHLRAAFETTLQHVPFPLRAVVKRVLVG
jgi:hypothetical protein